MLSDNQVKFLAGSAEFQAFVEADEHLNFLLSGSDSNDRHFELLGVMESLGAVLMIGELPVQPITPAVWSFLWAIGNNYTQEIKKITETDTDIFLYLLSHGVKKVDVSIEELPALCAGTVEKAHISYEEAAAELLSMIYHTFRPMEMIPGDANAEKVSYGSFWLAKLVSVVTKETGESAGNVIFNMPLSVCLNAFAARYAFDNPGMVYRRQSSDRNREIAEYMIHLGELFCASNGVI